jgi:Concanavalin A-like lectin/glucanases superfamily
MSIIYQSIQFKTTTSPVRYSTSRSPLRRGFLLIWFVLACFALSPPAQAQLPNIFPADDPSGSVNSGGANIAYLQNTTGSDVTLTLDGNTITTKANRLNIFDRSSGTWVEKVILDQQSQPISIGGRSTLLNGLRVYYKLGDLTDSSGNSLTLTNHGGVTFTAGKVNNAANFVSASTQYLSHADAAPFQMGTGDFSYALWIKFTATGTHAVLDYGQAGNTAGYATDAVDFGSGAVGFQIALSDGSRANYPFINTTHHNFNDGNWHLLVVTCSRSGNMVAYVDNVVEGSVSTSTATGSVNSTHGFALGADYFGTYLFDGSLDEFGLWNRVLTSTEITHLWNGGAGTTYPFTGL